ncbi:MAG: hypothetical protein JXB07_13965 [Anaerolineae bacterium]|nr:hypothetical protein [Anaerolineae bacterium]
MSDNQYNDSGREADEARERINRILRGGGSGAEQQSVEDMDDPLGGSEALSRARSRVRSSRANLGVEEPSEDPFAHSRARTSGGVNKAIIVIGGVVVAGVLLVLALLVVVPLLTGGGGTIALPFLATATSTPTITPTATATATVTPTATKTAPSTLQLPNLTCIYQSGTGCFDYCNDPANSDECQGAKNFVSAQAADPDVWLQCISPGSGANVGEPLECLRDAWRVKNP